MKNTNLNQFPKNLLKYKQKFDVFPPPFAAWLAVFPKSSEPSLYLRSLQLFRVAVGDSSWQGFAVWKRKPTKITDSIYIITVLTYTHTHTLKTINQTCAVVECNFGCNPSPWMVWWELGIRTVHQRRKGRCCNNLAFSFQSWTLILASIKSQLHQLVKEPPGFAKVSGFQYLGMKNVNALKLSRKSLKGNSQETNKKLSQNWKS